MCTSPRARGQSVKRWLGAAATPEFIAAIREGRRPTVHGYRDQSRDFTPVGNVEAADLAAYSVLLSTPASSHSSPLRVKVSSGWPPLPSEES